MEMINKKDAIHAVLHNQGDAAYRTAYKLYQEERNEQQP
jgi:hypothetical protein